MNAEQISRLQEVIADLDQAVQVIDGPKSSAPSAPANQTYAFACGFAGIGMKAAIRELQALKAEFDIENILRASATTTDEAVTS